MDGDLRLRRPSGAGCVLVHGTWVFCVL